MKIEHSYNGKKTGVWAEMVADSEWQANRISTMVVRLPRMVLAEFNTHRALSRNSASSRAIPANTFRQRVLSDPYVPWRWPVNGKGMVPMEYVDDAPDSPEREAWLEALQNAVNSHRAFERMGVHKEITNRLLEPWMWTEVLVTATDWENFLRQRTHHAAADGIRAAAECVRDLLAAHTPQHTDIHLPYIKDEERVHSLELLMLASARRCRRVSYLKQGVAVDMLEDAREGLSGLKEDPPHLSPYEHMAVRAHYDTRYANLVGWCSLRFTSEANDTLVERLTLELERAEKAQGDRRGLKTSQKS